MTSHDEMLDSVAAYALGVLPAAEAASVASHLQTCKACRAEYEFLVPAVTAVAYSAEADDRSGVAAPSPLLKARVMKHVRNEPARAPRAPVWAAYAVAAACLAIAIFTGLADLSLNAQLQREAAQASVQAQVIADLTAPDSQRFGFAGGEVVTHGSRLYIAMRDLPAPPQGRVYQAWTLPKGGKLMAPSVTFEPGSGGVTVLRLPQEATATDAVAVSVEPAGGSKRPTTKPIAVVRI